MLLRFDPFRQNDRLTEQRGDGLGVMATDAYRRGDEFLVHFDLPGVDPGSIDLTAEQAKTRKVEITSGARQLEGSSAAA